MESKSKEPKGVGAVELALGDSDCPFLALPSKNSGALPCATGDPESVSSAVELLWWVYGFPVCFCQVLERAQ